MSWYIRLFGTLELERGESIVYRFRTAKTGLLVAYLSLTPPHRFPREVLADLLWGDHAPERARHSLNMAISALRHALDQPDLPAGKLLLTDRNFVALNPAYFTTDVMQFEQALALASRAGADPAQRNAWRRRAVSLYRGELLAGYYEPWAVEAAARCHVECLNALRLLAQEDDLYSPAEWLHRLLQLEPLDWGATEQLAEFYLRQGQAGTARQLCDRYEAHWRRLYTEPPPEALSRLIRQCATTHPSPTPVASETSPKLAPRPRKQSAESQETTNHLPHSVDTFYGRTRELEQLWEWLIEGEARLVVVTGLGGLGKTRLSLEFARRVAERNVLPLCWVDLQAVAAPELLWNALQNALGLPAARNPQQQILSYLSQGQHLLILDNFEQLLPEGVEVIEAILARTSRVRLLITSRTPLRTAGEHTLALAPLGVDTSQSESLAPAVQLFADRAQRAAPDFRLTPERRAQVEQLCRRLDGIPLALELAAARAGVLSVSQMLERLEDRLNWLRTTRSDLPARHRSLLAVLDATLEAMEPTAHAAWLRLTAFRGDFSIEAASYLVSESDDALNSPDMFGILETLESLVAAGLLHSEERDGKRRLWMLETLREYAWKQQDPELQLETRCRLLQWTLDEARRREAMQFGEQLSAWLAFWDAEREHLLEAIRIAQAQNLAHAAFELLWRTRRYWMLRALHRFGEATLEQLIPDLPSPVQAQARLLQAEWATHAQRFPDAHAYALRSMMGDPEASTYPFALYYAVHSAIVLGDKAFVQQWGHEVAQRTLNSHDPALQVAGQRLVVWYQPPELAEESVPYLRFQKTARAAQQLNDPLWTAIALDDWIDHCMVVGRYEEALSLSERSRAIATSLRDGVRLQYIAQARAYSLMQLGRLQEAEQQTEEGLRWAHLTGIDAQGCLALKANLRRLQRDYDNALELIQQAEQPNSALSQAFTLEIRGLIERDRGDLWAARRFMERALQQRERDGDPFRLHFARTHRAYLDCKLGQPHAVDELMACLDYWRTHENSPWIATTLLYLAEIQMATGQIEAARASLAEALQRNRAMGRTLHAAACCELRAVLEAMEGGSGGAR